jgi:hypothetical protein
MARPVFILCAQGTATDRESGLLTIFQVIERLEVKALPILDGGEGVQIVYVSSMPVHVVCCWLFELEKGDHFGDEFHFEFRALAPPGGIIVSLLLAEGTFRCGEPERDLLQRIILKLEGPHPFHKPGWWQIQSRIRKKGTDEWFSQDYPIEVSLLRSSDSDQELAPGHGRSATS